ncbi:hypothetical protein COTS27_01252 [Spirochaetota bacterium]|nr:hypothetical protein COTS27_01252 [Spirochaetota bacterium]
MGDEELQEEEEEKVKPSLWRRFFSLSYVERIGGELLRLIIFAIIAFFIAHLVIGWNTDSTISTIPGEVGDVNAAGEIITRPLGVEWSMEEMIINTSDDLDNHFVKARIVIACEVTTPELISELDQRSGEIHAEVREIIGLKSYLDIKRVEQQRILAEEIKTRVQRIVGKSGIIAVYLKEFSVH